MASVVRPGSPLAQIELSSPTQVLLIGDSFVTRFSRYCARETVINCGIRRELVHFSTLGAGGAGISFVRDGALKRLIEFFPKIVYWKHRGMLSDYVSLLSDDGVHIAPAGERLYYRSIRGAVLFLSKRG